MRNSLELDIAIILGSQSDEKVVEETGIFELLGEFKVSWELSVLSAHRHVSELKDYCWRLQQKKVKVIIAIVGLKADLPSAIKAHLSLVPVIGVPLIGSDGFCDVDGLIHMPPGLPILVVGKGKDGIVNAVYAALSIIHLLDWQDMGTKFMDHNARKEKKKPRPAEVAKKISNNFKKEGSQ